MTTITSQKHIINGIQGWQQSQFLVDHSNAGLDCIERTLQKNFLAINENCAGVRLMSTGQQANQRALPCSVLTH